MSDPTRSRETMISSFSDRIFSAMLQEVLMDAVLQSHKDFMRSKFICPRCGMNCGSTCDSKHDKPFEVADENAQPASSITDPSSTNQSGVPGVVTPVPKDKHDGNIYFECTVCQKKVVASNRYAPHLSGCLGLDSRARRGAARNASTKNKPNVENDHSGSPGAFSEGLSPSVEPPNGKVKPKPKPVKKSNTSNKDSTELNNLKRPPESLDNSPSKKIKKQKTGLVSSNDGGGNDKKLAISVLAKLPNKGTTPASPSARSGSQYSGRESPAASITHSVSVSSLNGHSPNGFAKPVTRRPSKPGSAEQIAKKLQSQQQISFTNSEPLTRPKPPDKEEGLIDVDGDEPDDSSSDSSDD